MKKLFAYFLFIAITTTGKAQFSRYLIKFKNKSTNPYSVNNPSAYLSQRAIDRRTKYAIAIDSTDLPVTPRYLDSVRLAGNVTILDVSRWLNQVSIQTSDATALNKINSFTFVQSLAPIAARISSGASEQEGKKSRSKQKTIVARTAADFYNYGLSYNQIHFHNGEFLHNIGLRGQNMIIGMLDAGFYHYTSLKAFDSVNTNGQVLGVYDFVSRDNSVIEDDAHGMECFSIIAANIPGQFIGSAPKASFYLFRSEESATEYPIEEHNWVCAAERLDSAGGDVISSSLGYNTFDNAAFNHTYAQMNGNTTMCAIGADLAAKKGILVVNSAGNEGDNSWGKIVTPADGDSVLAVGAVSSSGVPAPFTSRGPSSDGQVKPDVVSVGVGTYVQTSSNTIGAGNGTSFSCPNMAGLATCLWQGFPEFNNIKILQTLQRASNRYTTPNDTTGYGFPDMKKAVMILLKDFATTSIASNNCSNTITWKSKDATGMHYDIERKTPNDTAFTLVGSIGVSSGSFAAHTYNYTDSLRNVLPGTVAYRIREVIDTARLSFFADYLDTVATTNTSVCANANEEVMLYPNPARDNVYLQITNSEISANIAIRIFDAKSAVVYSREDKKQQVSSIYMLPLKQLAKGQYIVHVYLNGRKLATKKLLRL